MSELPGPNPGHWILSIGAAEELGIEPSVGLIFETDRIECTWQEYVVKDVQRASILIERLG